VHVEDHLELEQVGAARHGTTMLAGMGRPGIPIPPRRERLLVLPLGDHEVAVVSGDGAQQLEAEEAGRAVDGMGTLGEASLEFGTGRGGHADGVDLHDGHGSTVDAVVQGDDFNRSSLATTVVVAVTSNTRLSAMPGNVALPRGVCGLDRDSVVNVTAVATVDKADVDTDAGPLPLDLWQRVTAGLRLVLHAPFAG
jgi:mRNA interferase MazF